MIITTSPVVVTRAVTTTRIEIFSVVDFAAEKRITAQVLFYTNTDTYIDQTELVLWSGDAYDTIGQWTDQDVIDRVEELLAI